MNKKIIISDEHIFQETEICLSNRIMAHNKFIIREIMVLVYYEIPDNRLKFKKLWVENTNRIFINFEKGRQQIIKKEINKILWGASFPEDIRYIIISFVC